MFTTAPAPNPNEPPPVPVQDACRWAGQEGREPAAARPFGTIPTLLPWLLSHPGTHLWDCCSLTLLSESPGCSSLASSLCLSSTEAVVLPAQPLTASTGQ